MTKKQTADDITNKLWAMANELSGNMDASEFGNYILGFMFYHYLSENQENYLIKQNIFNLQPNQSINEAYLKDATGNDLDDYRQDIASSLGYAIDPEFTWTSIKEKVEHDKIRPSDYQDMFDMFDKNAEINANAKNDFRGIFNGVNLNDIRLGDSTNSRAKTLNKIVTLVDQFDYNDNIGHDIIGDVYEFLIAKFASKSGKKAGEFYTPHYLSKVLAKLVTLSAPEVGQFTVYDPTMGSGSLLLTVENQLINGKNKGRVHFHGQELNTTTYNLARMNLLMHNVSYQNMDLHNGDTLEADWPDGEINGIDRPRSFDAVVANPPYSAKWDNNDNKIKDPRFKGYGKLAPPSIADYAFLLHGLYHLNHDGTMAIVLPHGVLFRGRAEEKIRKAIIENNYLDAVIGLPKNIFYSAGVILVLKKNRKNKDIFFIDASKHFKKEKKQNVLRTEDIDLIINTYKNRKDIDRLAHVANLDEIKENEFNLNIPRYIDTFIPEPQVNLRKVANDLKITNENIQSDQKELVNMFKDLTSQDREVMDGINAIIDQFEKELK